LAAGITKVPGARSEGPRAGNWLTRDPASRLLSLPDPETLKRQTRSHDFGVADRLWVAAR
ncbi:MAG TPA: hypothetical protein VEX68_08320, partial [Bryobacteraceae bacterium]|nr:hypothetical protein [Bryobacteraceae bacterium]